MNIKLIAIGKTSLDYIENGFSDYENRLKHYCNFKFEIVSNTNISKGKTAVDIKLAEAKILLKRIHQSDYVILLDEKGKQFSSKHFADLIQDFMIKSIKNLVFVIGGAYGFDNMIYERAQMKFSLSSLTFPHQLVRLIFVEQLYRAKAIINNNPYHHE